jgi:hypothetical protein
VPVQPLRHLSTALATAVPRAYLDPGVSLRKPELERGRPATPAPAPLVGFRAMTPLLASAAVSKDVGLIVTFIGIGVLVNIIVVFIAVQIRGERQQNQAHLTEPDRTRRV